MSRTVKACLYLCGFFAVCALAWMAFLHMVAVHELDSVTGFDFHAEVLAVNPLTGSVVVRGLVAKNPAAFPKPLFFEIRSLKAQVAVFSGLFSGRIVIDDLDVDIAKVELVRLHDGKTNAGELMAAFSRPGGAAGTGASAPGKPTAYLIRKLHVRFDQLAVADYSGSSTDEKSYNLHIDQEFTNISSPNQLLIPSVVRNLHSFGLHHDVEGLLPGDFGKALAGAVGSATAIGEKLKNATEDAGSYIKGAIDKLEQKAKQ
jgi:hypothetical protein